MNKKLLVLGLVCLLSQSVRAMEGDSVGEGDAPKVSDSSSEQMAASDEKVRSCCFSRLTSWMSDWSTCTKITAGLALVGTAVGLMYKYGCRCCEDTKKRVVQADA